MITPESASLHFRAHPRLFVAKRLSLIGRKDRIRFGPDLPDWIEGGWHAPKDYTMPDRPTFIKTDDHIALWTGTQENLAITSIAQLPHVTHAPATHL